MYKNTQTKSTRQMNKLLENYLHMVCFVVETTVGQKKSLIYMIHKYIQLYIAIAGMEHNLVT